MKANNDRKFPGERGPRADLAKIRREEAASRQEAYNKLSAKEKLEKLDEKLGVGVGAKKQRAKLQSLV